MHLSKEVPSQSHMNTRAGSNPDREFAASAGQQLLTAQAMQTNANYMWHKQVTGYKGDARHS